MSEAIGSGDGPAARSHTVHATGRQKLVGHLAMLAFSALVAGSFSFGALAAPHVGPAALNAVRFAIGTALMGAAAWLVLRGRVPPPRAPWRFLLLGALMAVFFVTMFVALRLTDPVSTGAVFTLMPLMAAGFGRLFLGQVPRPVVLASLALAGAGALWVIFGGELAALLAFDVGRGEMIFFVGVACHAAYAPLVRRLNRGEPVIAFTFWTLLATGLWIALYGAGEIAATGWGDLPAVVWAAILYLAVFTTAGTFFLLQFATLRLPASKVLAYNYLTPSLVILYEGLLGHGWASGAVLAGAAITVAGLALLALAPDG
ncbi:DMT family transporter [Aquibium sp. A9E412]|uniref:DMT family transporter n=1 Tax=Aquibium sp. A9E412 TaxID=2976767 RepID=UPI0025B0A2B2|nr:DMT family transporter [Aquibium sp. A9E412]MDN2566554.1 DMT family transporter [Aquibium sp. A9E412]